MNNYNIDNIRVSVVMPVYNDAPFIKETILSVLNQTHQNIELIIIDDNSDDNSAEIILSIKDKRIMYLKNETRMGAAYARNRGIKATTGDYIAFLDGDDIWRSSKIKEQLSFMLQHNISFCSCFYDEISEDGKSLGVINTSPDIITNKMFRKCCYIGCLTAIYKKAIYQDLSIPYSIKKRNDYALWLRLSERADCCSYKKVLASYRRRVSSISSGKKRALFKYHVQLFKTLYNYNGFHSFLLAMRNVLYFQLKKIKYKRKLSSLNCTKNL